MERCRGVLLTNAMDELKDDDDGEKMKGIPKGIYSRSEKLPR